MTKLPQTPNPSTEKQIMYYLQGTGETLKQLNSSRQGLNAETASKLANELGPNELRRGKRTPALVVLLRQFKDLLVLLLISSAGVSMYLRDFRTAGIMGTIALINAIIGFLQERKAENLLRSLEKLTVHRAKVIRGNATAEIDSRELVTGDIIRLEAGDNVPADARIIEEDELATNDFALTGESQPSRKFRHAISGEVPLGSRHNMVYMGTTVALGNGLAVVTGTGMRTELGRIADLSQSAHTDVSPLQREMNHLATRLTQGTILLAGLLLAIELYSDIGFNGALIFAISIAAAMIPNGLVAEVNITLAQTAARMARVKALVKKLSAVETLGATNIIATDKTGTLTKNEMTVTRLIIGRTPYLVSGTGYEATGSITDEKGKSLANTDLENLALFFRTGAFASNAQVNPPDAEHAVWHVVGDPTEGALITLARKAGIEPTKLDLESPEIKEYAFDSARKRMSSVREINGQQYLFVKGAPESVLHLAANVWDHGHTRPLTEHDRKFFLEYNETHAALAERNLAFAYRLLPKDFDPRHQHLEEAEQDLTYLGVVSMVDPLREDVPRAMKAAHDAHIKVSIITGDFPTTAAAIARQANLARNDIHVVMSEELAKLDDAQILALLLKGGAVFSRVSPEDKLRIVELAKNSGRVVAVTGDGINDAPALKRADIGVAMGRTGTDVAKDAAEIVLLDDSFATLITAVKQGRLTFQNLKKAARCALTDNAGELFAILISLAVNAIWHIPAAITAVQILAIDLVAEFFPVTALGWDPPLGRLMHEKPRDLRDHIINRKTITEFIVYGLLAAALSYANYLWFFSRHHISPFHMNTDVSIYAQATILTYVSLVLCQFVNLLIVRTLDETPLFGRYLWSNKKLLISFAISIVCILNIVYNPWVQPIFGAGALNGWDWLSTLLVAGIYTVVRLLHSHAKRHSRKTLFDKHHHTNIRKLLAGF